VQQNQALPYHSVMRGLVPGIHVFRASARKTWMAGSSPAMTKNGFIFKTLRRPWDYWLLFRPDFEVPQLDDTVW